LNGREEKGTFLPVLRGGGTTKTQASSFGATQEEGKLKLDVSFEGEGRTSPRPTVRGRPPREAGRKNSGLGGREKDRCEKGKLRDRIHHGEDHIWS